MKMLLKTLAVATLLAAGATAVAPAANAQEVVRHSTVVTHRGPVRHRAVRHCVTRRVMRHGHRVNVRSCTTRR